VLGEVRYIHAFQVGAQYAARMRRVVHFSGHVFLSKKIVLSEVILLSVVILVVHEDRVLAVESEGQAPVSIHPD
jgi:hypothetical protein